MTATVMAATAHAQLLTKNLGEGITPEQMVNTLLGGGIRVFNVQYTGATNASGLFCAGGDIVGFENGILLTSGDAANVKGPNDASGKGTDNELDGDADLDALIPGFRTFDASILSFDFVAQTNQVRFNYVFSSEEYNEFVDSPFNDVFGFFINGVNFARIPGTEVSVAINNLNNGFSTGTSTGPCMNCQFYIDNTGASPPRNTQMDGLTVVLTMTAPVVAGQTNSMKIAIADAGDHILDSAVFIEAGSFRAGETTGCVTRTARFWFSHPDGPGESCATLKNALAKVMSLNCDSVPLGFLNLPLGYHNDNNERDLEDAMIEALGLYWRSTKKTGETAGTQNQGLRGSKLCRARKELAAELIAALANNVFLGTNPDLCTYLNAGTNTTFPSDLIAQAREAAAGEDAEAIVAMTALLRRFNSSGQTNDFPAGIVECSALDRKSLRSLSRDPTTRSNCPGENDVCEAAETVVFSNANPFAAPEFKRSVNLSKFTDQIRSPGCNTGGRDAVWKITPNTGPAGRRFTVDTAGSNFDTLVSIWQGDCDALTPVDCNDDAALSQQSKVSFTTDGTNTFYIVVEGATGNYGRLKLKVTSP